MNETLRDFYTSAKGLPQHAAACKHQDPVEHKGEHTSSHIAAASAPLDDP